MFPKIGDTVKWNDDGMIGDVVPFSESGDGERLRKDFTVKWPHRRGNNVPFYTQYSYGDIIRWMLHIQAKTIESWELNHVKAKR